MAEVSADTQMERLLRRAQKAFEERDLWRSLLSTAYEFGLPMRNIWDIRTPGQQKMDRVFDSTLIVSVQKLGARLQSELTPIGQEWADFIPGPFINPDIRERVLAELQLAKKIFFSALSSSNFSTSVSEFYMDLIIGTGAMLVLEGDDEKLFQ